MSDLNPEASSSAAPAQSSTEVVSEILANRLQQIANSTLVLATVLLFLSLYSTLQTRNSLPAIVGVTFAVLSILAAFFRVFSAGLRGWLLTAAFGIVGLAGLSLQPLTPVGLVFLMVSVVLAALLLSQPGWQRALITEVVAAILVAVLKSVGLIQLEAVLIQQDSITFWGSLLIVTAFLAWLVASAASSEVTQLRKWASEALTTDEQVREKDQLLHRRNTALEEQLDRRKSMAISARQITRALSKSTRPEQVMQTAITLINQQFDFYYTGIFLKDENAEFAVLKAGSGAPGAEMLARQHKLRIREEGVVGYVVARGEMRIVSDVSQDVVHYRNPSLPLTQSEMAVPLLVGEEVIGALDVQSIQKSAFDEDTVDFLQTTAESLALALQRSIQIDSMTQVTTDIQQRERLVTERSWHSFLKGSRRKTQYQYQASEGSAKSGTANTLQHPGEAESSIDEGALPTAVTVPIKLRDQILGVIHLKVKADRSPAEVTNLVTAASDRLAAVLESTRLLEEKQELADREKLVSNFSDRIGTATDVDTVLKTTVQELGRATGADEVSIHLKTREVK